MAQTMMKTIRQNTTNIVQRSVSFHTTDSKGRVLGMDIFTYEVDFVEAPEATCYYTHDAGHYFVFQPQATRDNKCYGACQSWKTYADAETRDKAVDTYLAAAQKRARTTT